MKKRYIAYGSNMDEGQMAHRCPTARLLGQTEMEGYRLLFKGSLTGAYATIEPQEGGRVPALVWEIGEADEASLDLTTGCWSVPMRNSGSRWRRWKLPTGNAGGTGFRAAGEWETPATW